MLRVFSAHHHQIHTAAHMPEQLAVAKAALGFSAGVRLGARQITARSRSESGRASPRALEPKATRACTCGCLVSTINALRKEDGSKPGPSSSWSTSGCGSSQGIAGARKRVAGELTTDQRFRQLREQSPIELAPEGRPSRHVAWLRPQAASLVQMGHRITASPQVEERFEYPTH